MIYGNALKDLQHPDFITSVRTIEVSKEREASSPSCRDTIVLSGRTLLCIMGCVCVMSIRRTPPCCVNVSCYSAVQTSLIDASPPHVRRRDFLPGPKESPINQLRKSLV